MIVNIRAYFEITKSDGRAIDILNAYQKWEIKGWGWKTWADMMKLTTHFDKIIRIGVQKSLFEKEADNGVCRMDSINNDKITFDVQL